MNTRMMSLHLQETSAQVEPEAVVVLIRDGGSWYRPSTTLAVPDNIRLLMISPYSLQLNTIENVWNYLRQNRPRGIVWGTYEDIVTAYSNAEIWFANQSERIISIGIRSSIQVSI
ncbi:transposase [Acetobacter pasteurianus NBRC 3222]|nr:transposase [Acetobacter pasteurianus NBRC 3222]